MKQPVLTPLLLLAVLALLAPAAVAEEGGKTPRWVLGFEHGPLELVTVERPAGRVDTYLYMVGKVTNGTAFARDWVPLAKIVTDTGKTYVASGYTDGLAEVRRLEGNDALVSIESTTGKIEPGATIEFVAIFGVVDPQYHVATVQILGLADAIAVYQVKRYPTGVVVLDEAYEARNQKVLEAAKAEAGVGELPAPTREWQEVAERRAYEMRFERQGDEFRPHDDPITARSEGWTILGDPTVIRTLDMS
jgi:hypothetical protein